MKQISYFLYDDPTNLSDGKWILLLHHNSSGGVFFKNKEEALFSLKKNKYSVLNKLNDRFKNNEGKFEFMI